MFVAGLFRQFVLGLLGLPGHRLADDGVRTATIVWRVAMAGPRTLVQIAADVAAGKLAGSPADGKVK